MRALVVLSAALSTLVLSTPQRISATAPLSDARGVAELKTWFNAQRGHPRLVLLLSPTWPACVTGARWVQTELARHPKSSVRGFVLWFPMYRGDAKAKWPGDALSDARFTHRWDEPKEIGKFFLSNLRELRPRRGSEVSAGTADALWDAYLLYDAQAQWERTLPDGLVSWGRTVMRTRERLAADLFPARDPRR